MSKTEAAAVLQLSAPTALNDEKAGVAALLEIGDEMAASAGDALAPHFQALDDMIRGLMSLLMPALDRWHVQKRSVIWHDVTDGRASPSFVFVGLLLNMINSAIASRRLAALGLDRQARIIVRELTEVGDLLVAILGDQAFLDIYIASPEAFAGAKAHWGEQLRPWRVRLRARDAATSAGFNAAHHGLPELWERRWTLYDWLSKSAHIDYGALVVESVAADFDGRYDINLGGRVGHHTASTLAHLTEYLHGALALVSFLLDARHGWSETDPALAEPVRDIRAQLFGEGRPD
jgi:hypothetical protein